MCTIGGRGLAWARGSSVRACGACNARGCEEGGRAERAVPTVCAGLDSRTATRPSYGSWRLNRPSAPQLWEGRPVQCTRVRVCMRGVRGARSARVSYRSARTVGVCVGPPGARRRSIVYRCVDRAWSCVRVPALGQSMVRDRCGTGAGVPITHVCMYVCRMAAACARAHVDGGRTLRLCQLSSLLK